MGRVLREGHFSDDDDTSSGTGAGGERRGLLIYVHGSSTPEKEDSGLFGMRDLPFLFSIAALVCDSFLSGYF